METNNSKKALNTIMKLSLAVIGLIAATVLVNFNQNISEKASASASLFISPSSQEVNLEKSFTAVVNISAGESKVTGIDIILGFDPNAIKIDDVKPTTSLSSFNSVIKNEIDNDAGTIRYTAFTFDKNLPITGNVGMLTIYGSIPYNSKQGDYKITIKNSSLVVATGEGQNILSNLNDGEIKIIGGVPNSCGGTCGSNSNCQANYFCYQGYCRNPVCQSDSNCDCQYEATTKPTSKATTKPGVVSATTKAKVTSTPKGTAKPTSTNKSVSSDKPVIEISTLAPESNEVPEVKNEIWVDFSKYLVGISIITLFVIALFFSIKKYNRNKTHIMPPTNI